MAYSHYTLHPPYCNVVLINATYLIDWIQVGERAKQGCERERERLLARALSGDTKRKSGFSNLLFLFSSIHDLSPHSDSETHSITHTCTQTTTTHTHTHTPVNADLANHYLSLRHILRHVIVSKQWLFSLGKTDQHRLWFLKQSSCETFLNITVDYSYNQREMFGWKDCGSSQ